MQQFSQLQKVVKPHFMGRTPHHYGTIDKRHGDVAEWRWFPAGQALTSSCHLQRSSSSSS
jgi:hypothetical protein